MCVCGRPHLISQGLVRTLFNQYSCTLTQCGIPVPTTATPISIQKLRFRNHNSEILIQKLPFRNDDSATVYPAKLRFRNYDSQNTLETTCQKQRFNTTWTTSRHPQNKLRNHYIFILRGERWGGTDVGTSIFVRVVWSTEFYKSSKALKCARELLVIQGVVSESWFLNLSLTVSKEVKGELHAGELWGDLRLTRRKAYRICNSNGSMCSTGLNGSTDWRVALKT